MSTYRERNREFESMIGSLTTYDTSGNVLVSLTSNNPYGLQTTKDVVGNYLGNNPFDSIKLINGLGSWNGVEVDSQGRVRTRVVSFMDIASKTVLSDLPINLKSVSGSALASRASPNKPLVDLPVFLFELKDLPGMLDNIHTFGKSLPYAIKLIKQAGDYLLDPFSKYKRRTTLTWLGKRNLEYAFGWQPLISDLLAFVKLDEAYTRRNKQLKNLYGDRGLRRRVKIDEASTSTIADMTTQSVGFNARCNLVTTTKAERWGVVRWEVHGATPPTSKDLDMLTVRTLLGLNLDFATLWSVLPWSWMIDWFTDVGNYLDANRNTVPARVSSMSVMTRTTTTQSRTVISKSPWVKGGGGRLVRTTKLRSPVTLSILPAEFPFLGLGQVGILASLSVAKPSAWRLT